MFHLMQRNIVPLLSVAEGERGSVAKLKDRAWHSLIFNGSLLRGHEYYLSTQNDTYNPFVIISGADVSSVFLRFRPIQRPGQENP